MQYSDYFDFFSGFSFYGLSNSTSKTFVTSTDFRRRAFTDAFPFASVQEVNWPVPSFNSASTIVGDAATAYQISVDGPLRATYPTRTYFDLVDAGQPLETFQETMSHRADISTYEGRMGARSWVPIFGVGRIGVAAGSLFNLINYKLAGSRYVVSLGPAIPGVVVENQAVTVSDFQFKFGGFIGTDLEVYLGRSGFVKASAEYAISDKMRYQLLSIQTEFDPGGFSSYLAAGLRF